MKTKHHKGLTLVELMVALGVSTLLMAGFFTFFLNTSMGMFVGQERLKINADFRKLTTEMTNVARDCQGFVLYKSFAAADRDSSSDRLQTAEQEGDFLVFFQGELDTTNFDPTKHVRRVKRLVGYYRAPDNPADPMSMGPVRKFDITLANYVTDGKIEEHLPTASTISSYPTIVQFSRGLADGKLFHLFRDKKAVLVNGQIFHGNNAKRVTDTYNFTISPRS